MNRQLKNLGITLAALLVFPASAAWAQAGAAAMANKVGVINIRQAIVTTAEGKQASAQLQAQFDPQQNELQNMQKQIQTLQDRLNNGARTLSADEQTKLQRQGELLAREFQRKQDDLNEEVTAAQGDIVDTIGRKMVDVIEKYSKDNGFVVVLDSSAQGTPVVYGATQADITQEIIRLYDQAYPMKAGSSSAEPSRPAGTTTTPKPAAPAAAPPAASRPVTPAPAQTPAKKPTP